MIKRTLHYLWGKKSLLLIAVLVILLLPNTISRNLQVRDTTIITALTIDANAPVLEVTATKLKSSPGNKAVEYETVTYQGTDIRELLAATSLAHCTQIDFVGEPDLNILRALYNYQNLRSNTVVNGDQTLNQLLRNQYYCYPQSSGSAS